MLLKQAPSNKVPKIQFKIGSLFKFLLCRFSEKDQVQGLDYNSVKKQPMSKRKSLKELQNM